MKYIINEGAFESKVSLLKSENPNVLKFKTILQTANEINRNGRFYPKRVLEEGLNDPSFQEKLRHKSLYGEVGHPMQQDVMRQSTIVQTNSAFIITELWWEGDVLMGLCETMNTSLGRDMKGLIEQGSEVAFSLRAQGNVHFDNKMQATVVESPIKILTYDWVVSPSHTGSYIQSICEETRSSLLNLNQYPNYAMALTESEKIYNEGVLVDVDYVQQEVDYTQGYSNRYIKYKNMYKFNESDKVVKYSEAKYSVDLLNESENVIKHVITEDYVIKNLRHTFKELDKNITKFDKKDGE